MNLTTKTDSGHELLTQRTTAEGIILEPSYISFLRQEGYLIEDIEAHTVPSEGSEGAYLVFKIQTYPFPQNSPLLDVGEENQQISVWVCSCPGFRFHKSVDVSNGVDVTPDQCEECKHIKQCLPKSQKAQQDDNQGTLL